ncbi:dihydroxyacetone kinase subunit DhaK [Streptomyces sp. NPDC091292]|uniref:dihydroxyacetone kinase subunit DhaK n=1 Tax=Streptomyces sp. NPDC091292 TaxID=3365991 RepID=UPI0037FAC082
MTHFLTPEAARDGARGLTLAHPHIALCDDPLFLWSRDRAPVRRVGLVSGGGSGHEPLHTGLLGPGGLDAVAPGEVFASPHARQIVGASMAAAGASDGGVLHIVKNYTGDRVNFSLAADQLRAEGYEVAQVVVDDDVATSGSAAGRRGTAATVVVEKLLGAAADRGTDLAGLADLGTRIAACSRSLAVAARAHTSPSTRRTAFTLGQEIDYGAGIHGERGARTINSLRPTEFVVRRMLTDLLDSVTAGREGVILLVNGLGATTELELRAISALAHACLVEQGVEVAVVAAGTYTAALDTSGFSLTLTALSPGWLDLWCAPARTPLHLPGATAPPTARTTGPDFVRRTPVRRTRTRGRRDVLERLGAICATVHADLTHLDQRAGDGDFGDNFTSGVTRAVARAREDGTAGMTALAEAFTTHVGGTSGPLFGILFQHLAVALGDEEHADTAALAAACTAAAEDIGRIGGARVGDRTLLDALVPAAESLTASARSRRAAPLTAAALAAVKGAHRTAGLTARRGRSSYVGDHATGVADPGAIAVALICAALAETYEPTHATRLPGPSHIAVLAPSTEAVD